MKEAELIVITDVLKSRLLPNEIIDEILIYSMDFVSAIKLKCNNYITNALYNPIIHTWNWAAVNGHLEIIKFLHKNEKNGYTFKVINNASRNGHIKVLKWLQKNRKDNLTNEAMNWAAMNGHFDIVKFLYFHSIEINTHSAITWAGMNGHTEIVKFLNKKNMVY